MDTVIVLKVSGQLDVDRILPKQDANGDVVLLAAYADIQNRTLNSATHARIEWVNGRPTIGFWHEAKTSVEWQFMIDRSGSFEVRAETGVMAPKTKFEIQCGSSRIAAEIISTGGYANLSDVKVGTITIDKAGEHCIRIIPDAANWQPMNLAVIRLRPIR